MKIKMVLGFILFALVIKTKTKSYTSVTKKKEIVIMNNKSIFVVRSLLFKVVFLFIELIFSLFFPVIVSVI